MISICNHCGAQYQLPDKMLGKQARCKACKRLFVIVPAETEVELPEPTGSTAQMHPVNEEEDGLDALASAASGGDFAPAQRSRPRHRFEEEEDADYRVPRKMAKGAQASMAMGIASCVFVAAGLILMIIAMVNVESQGLFVTLGIITLGLLSIGAVLSMVAIANGTGAKSKIRRARHPLAGRSQATTGSLTGTIAIGLVFICVVTIIIFMARNPDATTFEKEVIEPASAAPAISPLV